MSIMLPTPSRPLGRPRSEHSRTALLDAAYRFLENQPVALISSLHIAREAGVSTATMYRWWPTKEALLLDAFLHRTTKEIKLVSDGSPLEQLREYAIQVGRFFSGKQGIVVARMLTAIQDNPPLRDAFLKRIASPRSDELREVIMEAIREGQLPAETNVIDFADVLLGPLFIRLIIGHEPISEKFVISTFEQQVAGAKVQSAVLKRKRRN